MTYLSQARAWLETVDPSLFPTLVVVALLLGQAIVRKQWPGVWEWCANLIPWPAVPEESTLKRLTVKLLRKLWQAIPSAIGGTALFALFGEELGEALAGAVYGLLAPATHETVKAVGKAAKEGAP